MALARFFYFFYFYFYHASDHNLMIYLVSDHNFMVCHVSDHNLMIYHAFSIIIHAFDTKGWNSCGYPSRWKISRGQSWSSL